MKKNDVIKLVIEDLGADGVGIGKLRDTPDSEGRAMTFFVKDTLAGDKVSARVTKLKKTYGYARLLEVLEPSPYRVEPKCQLHRKCGGCQIQALSYEKQLEYKENKVRNNLMRIGGFAASQIPMEPIIGMEEAFYYRNKAQFPVGRDKNGKLAAGFYASRTHDIIPVNNCLLGVPQNQEVMKRILAWMEQYGIDPYDEKTGSGLIRHILVRYGFRSKQVMVCAVINGTFLPKAAELTDRLTEIDGMTSISMCVNMQRNNVIMGNVVKTLWGRGYIEDFIGDVKFQISPLSFYQVNPVQTEVLYRKVLEFAELSGKEIVWDLYCGIGTISLFLAKQAKHVYGIEIIPQAVEDARRNAQINGFENVKFFLGEAEEVLEKLYVRKGCAAADGTKELDMGIELQPQVVVLDPPRKGCGKKLLDAIVKAEPEKIVYVSCDSATLARDLRYLCERGYEMARVQAVDQFCQTVHVETVVKLTLKKDTPKIEVTMEPNANISNYKPKERITYQKIKDYVKEQTGLNIHTSYIAQIKEKCGLDKQYTYEKEEGRKVAKCPPEKEAAIMDAFRHFGWI